MAVGFAGMTRVNLIVGTETIEICSRTDLQPLRRIELRVHEALVFLLQSKICIVDISTTNILSDS